MTVESITFDHDVVAQALGSTTLTGTLTIDYTTLRVTGSLTDGAGTVFNNFTAVNNSGVYTLTGGGGLLATVSVGFAGQAPGTVNVTYTSLGLLPATTNGVVVVSAMVCFASGTLIRTDRGDVVVEELAIGDLVVTASGEERPIKWIGHRTVNCADHPKPHHALPIRISAHAFGANKPARDLFVSPGHSLCVDVVGEVLIPASALVNSSTIQQVVVDEVTYWHIELESHDVLIAENLPAESYLDMRNRSFFKESDVVAFDGSPDADIATITATENFCRPFHIKGPLVDAVSSQLRTKALAQGWTLNDTDALGGLHLVADGVRIDPVVRGLSARFAVPAGAEVVWLVSPTSRVSDVANSVDSRNLGVCLRNLSICDTFEPERAISLDDGRLSVGFLEVEGCWRWTSGRARLSSELWQTSPDGFFLRVDLEGPALPRWVAPAEKAAEASAPLTLVA